MAAVDVSDVRALCKKGVQSYHRGRFARAAGYYAEAAEAARALRQPADCLILASLGVYHAECTALHAGTAGVEEAEKLALLRRALAGYDAAAPVLQRRRAAGTLMGEGRRAAEKAFALAFSELQYEDVPPAPRPGEVAHNAALIQYAAYLIAADGMLNTQVGIAITGGAARVGQLPELADAQLAVRYAFIASALDLMAQPRAEPNGVITESVLLESVRSFERAGAMAPPVPGGLLAAWQRLQRSGVLRARNLEAGREYTQRYEEMVFAAAAQDAERRGLRACALAGCAAREVHASQFKVCSACKQAVYCCREHQTADWPSHKAACKAARKAAAAAAEASGA
jgi:hypothetical protein